MVKFELTRLTSYDQAALLAELRRVAQLVPGLCLTKKAFDQLAKCSSTTVRRQFGSWEKALSAAGIRDRFSGGVAKQPSFSDEQLLTELRLVGARLGGSPVTVKAFQQHGRMNAATVRRRFRSWGKALAKAGLEITKSQRRYSDDDYFENLLAVWTYHGRQPTYGEMNKPQSRISADAYEAKWGTWRKALMAFIKRAEADSETEPSPTVPEGEVETVARSAATKPRSRAVRRPGPRRDTSDRGAIPLGLRYQVLKRDHFRCLLCGTSPANQPGCELHVDHVIPRYRDGRTEENNLRTLCSRCNLGKGSKLE